MSIRTNVTNSYLVPSWVDAVLGIQHSYSAFPKRDKEYEEYNLRRLEKMTREDRNFRLINYLLGGALLLCIILFVSQV